MTDSNRTDGQENHQPEQAHEKVREPVGEMLRKHREMRGLQIENIARDLKLNASYIKALEANNRDQLPADPYVRVYLRAIAGYLMLDPEEVLSRYYEEKGLKPSDYKEDRSTKITITMKKPEAKRTPWVTIAIVIGVLAVLGLLAGKAGWIYSASTVSGSIEVPTPSEPDSSETGTEIVDSIAEVQASLSDSSQTDSTIPVPAAKDTLPHTTAKDSMLLELAAQKDSIWFQVFYDGISWRNFIYYGKPKYFTAKDSFNVHIGNCSIARVKLNGTIVKTNQKGVSFLKIDKKAQETWNQTKWTRTFGKRLD